MRWKLPERISPKPYDYKIARKFAFWPIKVETGEYVWLEWYYECLQHGYDVWYPAYPHEKSYSATAVLKIAHKKQVFINKVLLRKSRDLTSSRVMARLEADAKREAEAAKNAP